jgi:hypothetical protein
MDFIFWVEISFYVFRSGGKSFGNTRLEEDGGDVDRRSETVQLSLLALIHRPFHARALEACLVLGERHCQRRMLLHTIVLVLILSL